MRTGAVVYCAAMALALPTPDDSTERAMMQPLSAAASGNYTISFMPLLTVLVNMFPRLMSQNRLQPLTATVHARKLEPLWEWEQASLCKIVESTGLVDDENPCYFYSCSFNDNSYCGEQVRRLERNDDTLLVKSAMVDDCTTLEVRRCSDPTKKYNPQLSRCEPIETNQRLVCEQTVP